VPLAIPADGGQVHLFTDGVAPVELPKGTLVHSVFEPADNIAVTAFEVRTLPQDPTRVEALVQMLNASSGDQRARLLIKGGESFSVARDVDLRAGEIVNASIDVSDFEGGVLGATIIGRSDALTLDDLAYAIVPPHRPKRVLLVTPGNPDLADALHTMPGVVLTVVVPEGYSSRAGEYDALVFDRFAPTEPPASGALLLRPPVRNWLASEPVPLAPARITHWNHDHVVSGGVAWTNLRLERASVETNANPYEVLVSAAGPASGALVTAGESRARWIKVGFALQDSNFRMQPDFPVFLGNALRWVTERTPVLTHGLGSIEVAVPEAEVRDGSGKPVATSSTVQGVVFQAPSPDVYSVSGRSGRVLVVANLTDPRYVQINQTPLASGSGTAGGSSSASPWYPEPWMLLLLAACVLLVVEWAVYSRRVRT
jgi:hypothetical protein